MNTQTQDIPTTNSGGGFLFATISGVICIFFLKFCIEEHVISTAFIGFIDLFFDKLSIKAQGSYSTEVMLLAVFCFFCFGVYALFRFYFAHAITYVFLLVVVIIFYSSQPEQKQGIGTVVDKKSLKSSPVLGG